MANKRTFTWNSGATAATGATGASSTESTPNPYKVVHARLGAGDTGATVLVYGSIDGGVTHHLLDTLTLTGSAGEDAYEGANAYDRIDLNITSVTGTVTASVRSV